MLFNNNKALCVVAENTFPNVAIKTKAANLPWHLIFKLPRLRDNEAT